MTGNWVTIHTDGSCSPNPGPATYGAVLEFRGHKKEISGRLGHMTNNQAELMAVVQALRALKKKGLHIAIYSDSQYVVQGARQKWEIATNLPMWRQLWKEVDKHQEVIFNWVPRAKNVAADSLAQKELRRITGPNAPGGW